MRCSNCGKETPFGGKVCHWCGNDKSKDQKTYSIIMVIVIIAFFLIWKCSCNNSENDNNIDNVKNNSNTEYNNYDSINQETISQEPKLDDLFEVYNYMYSKETVIKAETNVLFVNGNSDELQITIDMPNGETHELYLTNKVSLGNTKGIDSYTYTSDSNEKINIFFKNGREMMGMTSGKESFVFMNTPNYKE